MKKLSKIHLRILLLLEYLPVLQNLEDHHNCLSDAQEIISLLHLDKDHQFLLVQVFHTVVQVHNLPPLELPVISQVVLLHPQEVNKGPVDLMALLGHKGLVGTKVQEDQWVLQHRNSQ